MAITLASVQANLADDIDFAMVDELRRASPYLLNLIPWHDTVIPLTGGGTLTAAYTRLDTTRPAHTRQENTEYPAFEAKKKRVSTDLVPVGGRYNIDTVHARIGASPEVLFQQDELLKAIIMKFNTLVIRGVASDFSTPVPEFNGLDSMITGTITEWKETNGDPFDFSNITDKNGALRAKRQLQSWLRKFDGKPDVFLVNDDGAAWLDTINDYIQFYNVSTDAWGGENPTFQGIPYVNLGLAAGTYDQDSILTGATDEEDVIPTDADGVTSIYAARIGLNGFHGFTTSGGMWDSKLPDFSTAGRVKSGEIELGPIAVAAKTSRSIGAFRVKVQ